MKEIALQGKYIHDSVALVDDEDYEFVSQFSWHNSWSPHRCDGAYASAQAIFDDGSRGHIMMHRLITGWRRVDHKDGNGLNNQRSNLREATQQQNMWNARNLKQRGGSHYRGVTRRNNWWIAAIGLPDGKRKYLGRFSSEEAAARAWDAAALATRGEFARLNFPSE